MAATAKKAATPEARRAELAKELVGLHVKHAPVFARIDELKTALKAIATDAGSNFQEIVVGQGKVSVAGAKEKQFTGNVPTLVAAEFNALPALEQKRLTKSGLIAIVENYSGAYYGAVTVKLF